MHKLVTSLAACCLLSLLAGCSASDSSSEQGGQTDNLRASTYVYARQDGTVDQTTFEYAADGALLRSRLVENGTPVEASRYEFNDAGELLRREFDDLASGAVDRFEEYQYEDGAVTRVNVFDAAGVPTSYRQYISEDGRIVRRETWTFDDGLPDGGREDDVGRLTRTLFYEYEDERLTRFTVDFDVDGTIDGDMVHSYNADGTIATIVHTTVAEGTVWTQTLDYEAGPCFTFYNEVLDYSCVLR